MSGKSRYEAEEQRRRRENLYHEEIAPHVWAMHNHKWALHAWYSSGLQERATLLHLDQHWDAVDDFRRPGAHDLLTSKAASGTLEELIAEEGGIVNYVSFIAAAVRQGLLDSVHNYCQQDERDSGFGQELLDGFSTSEQNHDSLESIISVGLNCETPTFVDLDLDLFNHHYLGTDSMPELLDLAEQQVDQLAPVFSSASVVTIATSPTPWAVDGFPGCDWSSEIAEEVYDRVVPKIIAIRSRAT